MLNIVTCLTQQHDLPTVGLTVFICIAASYVAVTLLEKGMRASGAVRWLWLATAGTSGGFGIWATHFIAMLAYDPPVAVGYGLGFTLLSLVIAVVATLAAVNVAAAFGGRFRSILAGVLFGLGIASMHFTGMSAVEFQGHLAWNAGFVWASVAIGTLLAALAFTFAAPSQGRPRPAPSALLMALSVLAMHFTAMTAVTFVPDMGNIDGSNMLSHDVMIVVIVTVSLSLLASVFSVAMFAVMVERRTVVLEKNFRLLVQGVTDYAIIMLDSEGRVSNWNAGAERATGYHEDEILGRHFSIFYSDADRTAGLPARTLDTALAAGKFEDQGLRYRKDGSFFWAHMVTEPLRDDDGKFLGYAAITKDITQHKHDCDRIADITRNFDVALENMAQAICFFDADGRLILANKHYSELFCLPESAVKPGTGYLEIIERGFKAMGYPDWQEKAQDHHQRRLAMLQAGGGRAVTPYRSGISLQEICTVLPNGGWVTTFEDVTERLRTDEKIAFMARHDTLTGLPNRIQFSEYLDDEIMVARRTDTRLAVIGIDLDKFKEINDQHGHSAGDAVLSELALRLAGAVRGEELVARFGGDEFAAVKRFGDMPDLLDFIDRLETCLHEAVQLKGFDVNIGASLGVALYPRDATAAEALVANADMAMYRAKQSLVQRVCFYEAEMDDLARDRRALAHDLWAATERGEMQLHYQVQKSVATGGTTGYEVLLRWRHPVRGNIPPAEFIPLAEQCGAILPLGEWVLREACRQASKWKAPRKIAVNLSPVQLSHVDMARVIMMVLFETGLDPRRLEIEITESSIILDKERALNTLRQIKNLGVSIAIDDFGTGYSSLETLRAFPFDKIKLDKSFMAEVESSSQSKAIVRAILALGQTLDISVLAEGVETQAQLEILAEENCDEAQGYLLGKPVPLEELSGVEEMAA